MTDILLLRPADLGAGWTLPPNVRAAVICGDSVHAVLDRLAPGAVAATITDPPYSSGGAFRGDRSKGTAAKYLNNMSEGTPELPDFYGDTRSGLAHLYWLQTALAQCWAATQDGGPVAVFTDWRQIASTTLALEGAGWVYRGCRPWVKPSGSYRMQWQYPGQDSEFCVWGTRGPLSPPTGDWWTPSPPSPWTAKAPRGDAKLHQTEKPLAIMRDLARLVPPGAVVLDPFCGSGTTLEAALLEGRRAIGVELAAEYAARAVERLRHTRTARTAAQEVLL